MKRSMGMRRPLEATRTSHTGGKSSNKRTDVSLLQTKALHGKRQMAN